MTTNHPTTFVIFGVTGDLAKKKLFPALLDLFESNYLPDKFNIVGVARRDLSLDEFKGYVKSILEERKSGEIDNFLDRLSYVQGEFNENNTYLSLGKHLGNLDTEKYDTCSNKLFYLSVPPSLFNLILNNLASSGLTIPCSDSSGWTRVLVEKPFGNDLETAEELDMLLGKLFREEQIFRIDHYLAKETVQNILTFRFSNTLFEPLWNSKYIDSVNIKMFEENTAKGRGSFYDSIGALRDVGQNHLLQLLSLIAMEPCSAMNPNEVRERRAKVFNDLKLGKVIARAQYEGFKEEEGVKPNSDTETFFALKAFVNNKRWKGVPFNIIAGKGLDKKLVEIEIKFKDMTEGCFIPREHEDQEQNTLTFRVQPEEGISVKFWAKQPGLEKKIGPRELSFSYHEKETEHIDAYEKVIYDCIVGDQMLFASTDEVIASWKFITPIVDSWKEIPLKIYNVGSNAKDIIDK